MYAKFVQYMQHPRRKKRKLSGPTERLTNISKTICHSFFEGRHKSTLFELAQHTLEEFLRSAENYLNIIWDALRFLKKKLKKNCKNAGDSVSLYVYKILNLTFEMIYVLKKQKNRRSFTLINEWIMLKCGTEQTMIWCFNLMNKPTKKIIYSENVGIYIFFLLSFKNLMENHIKSRIFY